MTKEEKQDLAKDALRYLVQLLPPAQYGEDSRCEVIEHALQTLASDGVSADVRCRFDSGDQVRVKFRKLDRFWNGMVHKDDGGRYVEVIKNGLHWEITKVERDRIKIAS